MAHTLPDYSTKYKMANIFGQIDTGELAARLGSINTFDRRGNTLWYDDFEGNTLLWLKGGSGTGHEEVLSTELPCRGSQSCKLQPGNLATNTAFITKYLPLPVTSTFGLEFRVTYRPSIDRVAIYTRFYDGTTLVEPEIELDYTNDKIEYKDENGAMQDLQTNCKFNQTYNLYNMYKLVLNYTDKKYMRFSFNNTTTDISSYSFQSEASATKPSLQILIIAYAETGSADAIFVDDVILTQNEP